MGVALRSYGEPVSASAAVVTVPIPQLRTALVRALVRAGVAEDEALLQAENLLEGDLRGHPSHGARRLPLLVERIHRGLVTSGVPPTMTWTTESVLEVDGRDGLGAVVAHQAIDEISDRARSTGIALACVRKAHHVGMLAPHVERIAQGGMIAIAMTTSEALVHPWGGTKALLGTNPLGIAIPTGRADAPFVLDMSTAAVSRGRILDHAERGLPLPPGWAVDDEGTPATDPATAQAISPFGGPKGFALGLALELLVAQLTQTEVGARVHGTLDATEPVTKGDVFLAVSLKRLGIAMGGPNILGYLEELRGSSADPATPVLIPGDRARVARERHTQDGVHLSREVWEGVRRLADGKGPTT